MMRLPVIAMTIGGLCAIALSYTAAGHRILATSSFETEELSLEVPSMDDLDVSSEEPYVLEPLPVRPVAPDVFAAPPAGGNPFERVEEREPLSPMGRATRPSDLPPQKVMLHRPVVSAAGAFEAQGHKVALEGIEVTDPDTRCGEGAREWPCGIHARTAFRTWLRGRALSCVVRPVPVAETVVSACSLGNNDPGEWLVAQGWVRALAGGPYAELGADAERDGRGLYGPAPDTSLPESPPAE